MVYRKKTRVGIVCSLALAAVGCATVDPQSDYDRVTQLIEERTGATETYSPAIDELVDGKVDALLADGLTVDEAVRVCLLNNRSFQAMFQKVGASRADVVQSGLVSNPSISLMVQFPEGGGRTKLDLGISQQLVDLWQIPVRRKIADAQLEETILDVTRRAIELTAEVKTKCYRYLSIEQAEAITQQNIELSQQSLELAMERFKAGEASRLDVNLTRAKLLEVELEALALRRDRQVAQAAVARVLGLSRSTKPWVLKDSLPQPTTLMDDVDLITHAMSERIDARMIQSQVAAAEQELALEWLKVVPNVTAGAALERSEARAIPGRKVFADTARESVANGKLTAPSIQSKAQRDLERRQIIDALLGPSLDITLPIFDQNQAQIAKAKYKVAEKRKAYEDLLDDVANQVRQAAAVARNAAEQVRNYADKILPQAQENVEAARRLYLAGEQSILVLIESQETLIKQRRLFQDVLRDYAVAIAELQSAVGGRLPAGPTTQPQTAMEPAGPPIPQP